MKGKEIVPWCGGMHELEPQGEGLLQTMMDLKKVICGWGQSNTQNLF
jgi:hypothetical protein